MIDSKLKKPGKLVKFRGRRCVVQPSSDNEIVLLKPLGGSDDEMISVFEPVLQAFDKLEDDKKKGGKGKVYVSEEEKVNIAAEQDSNYGGLFNQE